VILACNGEHSARLQLKRRLQTLPPYRIGDSPIIIVADPRFPHDFGATPGSARDDWTVASVTGGSASNRSTLLNLGARRALEMQADYLCFVDSDVPLSNELLDAVAAGARPRTFSIAGLQDEADLRVATGFIALSASDFVRSAGFDESFEGWRCLEEIEFRLRLHVAHQLRYKEISLAAFGPDLDRDTSWDEPSETTDLRSRNREYLHEKLLQWVPQLRSRGLEFNDSTRMRLLYQPSRSL
jgi:hypothetical protein